MNTSSFGVEKATLIRVPAVANLMVDSADRDSTLFPSPFQFQIVRNQPLMSGFFTRIGTTEVVVEWCQNNIVGNQNDFVIFDVSGWTTPGIQIAPGVYNVAQCLDALVAALNPVVKAHFGAGCPTNLFDIQIVDGASVQLLTSNGTTFSVQSGTLANQLDFLTDEPPEAFNIVACPDLRPYRYMDIVCEYLTAVQDAKDGTTQTYDRDVLIRWYFSEDTPSGNDAYGFPILMGYERYCRRRIYNPPKQIKWEQNTPITNLTFACYDEFGNIIQNPDSKTQWLMTLQLSEG